MSLITNINNNPPLEINIADNTPSSFHQHLISSPIAHLNHKKSTTAIEYPHQDDTSFVSSPTTSTSSRRSSFSSLSSSSTSTHHHSRAQCNSLPPKPSSSLLYPTLKAAHQRIEYLEEQMKSKREANESIVKDLSFQIETFLKNKKEIPDLEPPHQEVSSSSSLLSYTSEGDTKKDNDDGLVAGPATMAFILNKLNELKQHVDNYHIALKADDDTTATNAIPRKEHQKHYFKDEIFFSTQIIEKWVSGVTQHDESKQDVQNVVQDQKYPRLVQALQTLIKKHTTTKKQLQALTLSEKAYLKEIAKLQKEVEKKDVKLRKEKEEKNEMEELVEEVRKEMEDIMEELNAEKLQCERYFEKSTRLEADLKAILSKKGGGNATNSNSSGEDVAALQSLLRESEAIMDQMDQDFQDQLNTHAQEISCLLKEKDSFKQRLATAERSVAELSLLMEVQKKQHEQQLKQHEQQQKKKKQHEQQPSEMEQVLRRTVAERDGELAKLTHELEKAQRQAEQIKSTQEKQLKLELNTRLQDMEHTLKTQYKKESDTYQLRISREVRELTCQVVELEMELQDLQSRHEQDALARSGHEEEVKGLKEEMEKKENKFKETVNELKNKIVTLEKDVLTLYAKNLELAQHLGELDLDE